MDEPPSQEGLSTRYEQGKNGTGSVKEVAQEETPALSKELEAVRRERDEYLDNMRRMKAELENSRARLAREHARSVELASERLVRGYMLNGKAIRPAKVVVSKRV